MSNNMIANWPDHRKPLGNLKQKPLVFCGHFNNNCDNLYLIFNSKGQTHRKMGAQSHGSAHDIKAYRHIAENKNFSGFVFGKEVRPGKFFDQFICLKIFSS